MNIKSINFDFYGTLVDWLPIWTSVSEKIVKENNLAISSKELATKWRAIQRKLIEDK